MGQVLKYIIERKTFTERLECINWRGFGGTGCVPADGATWTKGYMQHVVLFAWVVVATSKLVFEGLCVSYVAKHMSDCTLASFRSL